MKIIDQNVRVAISEDNPSIARDEKRSIKCGECARVCSKVESVNCSYNLANVKSPICVNCGQCVKGCPTGAMYGKEEYKFVQEEINNKQKIVAF